jgi:hypothetical protein
LGSAHPQREQLVQMVAAMTPFGSVSTFGAL